MPVRAFLQARSLLKQLAPDAVLGAGGYVAGPVGLAAVTLRIPLVLSEADSHLGLTNRLLARAARRVCLAFPLAGREGPRYRVTGRPIPPVQEDRAGARERLGIAGGEECVLVFGGSLGARSINEAAVEAFAGEASLDTTPDTHPQNTHRHNAYSRPSHRQSGHGHGVRRAARGRPPRPRVGRAQPAVGI